MTSQLNVDTIVDKAGSGGTNVKIGNTSTYVSEGGGATQNTVQSLVKQFSSFGQKHGDHQQGIVQIQQEIPLIHQIHATAVVTVTLTNNMNNITYNAQNSHIITTVNFKSKLSKNGWLCNTCNFFI